jgi:hypothetical protein
MMATQSVLRDSNGLIEKRRSGCGEWKPLGDFSPARATDHLRATVIAVAAIVMPRRIALEMLGRVP